MQFPLPYLASPKDANYCTLLQNQSLDSPERLQSKKTPSSAHSSPQNFREPTLIDHPVFNEVYSVCRYLNHIENLTEVDVQDRLSQLQYHAHKSSPTIKDNDINIQSTDPKHIQFTRNLVYGHAKLFTAHPLDVGVFNGPPVHLNLSLIHI